jgi:hypothetical protein
MVSVFKHNVPQVAMVLCSKVSYLEFCYFFTEIILQEIDLRCYKKIFFKTESKGNV